VARRGRGGAAAASAWRGKGGREAAARAIEAEEARVVEWVLNFLFNIQPRITFFI
jgi:hypothetical protein